MNPVSTLLAHVREFICGLPAAPTLWVGFSGGADSTALLVAMHELSADIHGALHAVHFNHGLQAAAPLWEGHCQAFCKARNIPCHIELLHLRVRDGHGPEAQARHHRYSAMRRLLGTGDIFLTAHHADDNVETFLINLLRGSGIDGLAGIPPLRRMGKGWVARPLLNFRRSALESFLRERQIAWMEDPSNLDTRFDRNFFRSNIIPELEKRWPKAVPNISQTARHVRQFAATFTTMLSKQYGNLLKDDITLPLPAFMSLELDLQLVLIRHWIRDQDIMTPPRRRLGEFLQQLHAPQGRAAELRWAGWMLKRHGKYLWLHATPAPGTCPSQHWDSVPALDLGAEFGGVQLVGGSTPPGSWHLGARRKGAGMRLREQGHHQELNELLRLSGIPPWLRDSVPVLYWHDDVVAVGDWLISPRLQHWLDAEGTAYAWKPGHPLLRKLQSVSVHFFQHTDPSHGQNFGTTT